jgi:uncharacterized circularly permuted ATP-grasp superfamily protein
MQFNYPKSLSTFDEMFLSTDNPREHYQEVFEILKSLGMSQFKEKEALSRLASINQGITFTVYSDGKGIERIFPFDLIPRIVQKAEWSIIESGVIQRIKALNSPDTSKTI